MVKSYELKWCFIVIAILTISSMLQRMADFRVILFWQYVAHNILLAGDFLICWLIHAYFKLHQIKKISSSGKVVISSLLGIMCVLCINYFVTLLMASDVQIAEFQYKPTFTDFMRHAMEAFFLTMVAYVIYNVLFTNGILNKTRLENEQLKQVHLQAQLLSLQQQISPHFLFNSLSTLKTITQESDTKHFVIQLSHVYRYLLNMTESPVSKLSEELNFIKSYLYILNRRFESALSVTIEVAEASLNNLIPPLSIQLLVENVIKHNVISPDAPLTINIYVNESNELVVRNPYRPKRVPVESTKTGLQNINDRFLLLFDKKIKVQQTEEFFTVTLPLIANECNYH